MDLSPPVSTQFDLDPDDVSDHYVNRGFAEYSDDQIFDVAAGAVSVPRRDPANSFILHAPLELLARRALLEYVAPAQRDAIRQRMLWVAATYARAAEPADAVAPVDFASVDAARAALAAAIDDGDLDAVDAAASWMSERAPTEAVVGLAPVLVDSLAAAGHAIIYFNLLPRVAPRSRSALALLRPLAREVSRLSALRIEWIRDGLAVTDADAHTLAVAIAGAPRMGLPGSDFIFPIVHQVDASGIARDIVNAALPATVDEATRAVLRVSALSMLQDNPDSAPYGWTHCLTLSQAALGVAHLLDDPAIGSAIAATYVVAFRAALSTNDLSGRYEPEPVAGDVIEALSQDPGTAAAATYHASVDGEDAARVTAALAACAGAHEDAHLAKYTLACFDAATRDPGQRRLYLAAAAYLSAWWRQQEPTAPTAR